MKKTKKELREQEARIADMKKKIDEFKQTSQQLDQDCIFKT
jgi:hypothetical protein